ALRTVLRHGTFNAARGTVEYGPVLFGLRDPRRRLVTNPTRAISPHFLLAEFLWIFDGCSDIATVVRHNAAMRKYTNDGVTVGAAYGQRLRHWAANPGGDQRSRGYQPGGFDQLA